MMVCNCLKNVVDWSPDAQFDPLLREHVRTCPSCRETLARWNIIEREIVEIERLARPHTVSDVDDRARRLVLRARYEKRQKNQGTWIALGALAAAASLAAIFMAFPWVRRSESPVVATQRAMNSDGSVITKDVRIGDEISSLPGTRTTLALGGDRIALGAESSVRIEAMDENTTRLFLFAGEIACAVEHRRPGQTFEVRSGWVRVQVVGTRFSVTRSETGAVSVAVDEGEVTVFDRDRRWAVRRGSGLRLGAGGNDEPEPLTERDRSRLNDLLGPLSDSSTGLESAKDSANEVADAPADGDVDFDFTLDDQMDSGVGTKSRAGKQPRDRTLPYEQWRTLILEGKVEDARGGISGHLSRHPRDVQAWALLADCERKSGRWQQAIDAYAKIVALGNPKEKQRALFRSGAILQDKLGNQSRAATMFERYLARAGRTDPMKAEAMLRLARAERALGRSVEAKRLLENIVRDHGGTSAASQAADMLRGVR